MPWTLFARARKVDRLPSYAAQQTVPGLKVVQISAWSGPRALAGGVAGRRHDAAAGRVGAFAKAQEGRNFDTLGAVESVK
jgi:hypothetical protein